MPLWRVEKTTHRAYTDHGSSRYIGSHVSSSNEALSLSHILLLASTEEIGSEKEVTFLPSRLLLSYGDTSPDSYIRIGATTGREEGTQQKTIKIEWRTSCEMVCF